MALAKTNASASNIRRISAGPALLGAALVVALIEFISGRGASSDRLVTALFGGFALASLSLLPGLAVAHLGRSRRGRARWGLLPLALIVAFVGLALTQGQSVRAWRFTPVLRVAIVVGVGLTAFLIAPRLARRSVSLTAILGAVIGLSSGLAHAFVFPGLYPAFHFIAVILAVSGVGFALGHLGPFRRSLNGAVIALGGTCLVLLIAGLTPGHNREYRRLLLAEGLLTSHVLPYLVPESAPVRPGPLTNDPVLASLAREPLPSKLLDDAFPNRSDWSVLIITIDALRRDHTGLGENGRSSTPHLDRFGEQATVFTHANATYPTTASSIYSLLTGCYPTELSKKASRGGIARTARAEGLRTGALLSFGMDFIGDDWPVREGFDTFEFRARAADAVTDRALAWWDESPQQRRFLWLHYFDAHAPYRPLPAEIAADGGTTLQRYRGEVEVVDREFQRLLEGLETRGALDSTVIVVHADHGIEQGEHGGIGQTPALYGESIAVPLLIYLPSGRPNRASEPVDLTRVSPTITELLGWTAPSHHHGNSLAAYLVPDAPSECFGPSFALAHWRNIYGWGRNWDTLTEGHWKLLVDRGAMVEQLFDLRTDPGEMNDVAAQDPDRCNLMLRRLERLLAWTEEAEPRSAAALSRLNERARELSTQNRERPRYRDFLTTLDEQTKRETTETSPALSEAGRLFDKALTEALTDEERADLLSTAAFTPDIFPETTAGMTAALPAELPGVRRAAAAALMTRDAERFRSALASSVPEIATPWWRRPQGGDPDLQGEFDLLSHARASRPEFLSLAPFALTQERLSPPTRALLWSAVRKRRDFSALAARYLGAIQPPMHEEESRALLVDVTTMTPALGEPLLRVLSQSQSRGVSVAIDRILASWGRSARRPILNARERRLSELRRRFADGIEDEELSTVLRRLLKESSEDHEGVADWGLGLEIIHLLNRDEERLSAIIREAQFPSIVADDLTARALPRAKRVVFEEGRISADANGTHHRLTLKLLPKGGPWRGEFWPIEAYIVVAFVEDFVSEGYPCNVRLPAGGLPADVGRWLSAQLPRIAPEDVGKSVAVAAIEHNELLGHVTLVLD